jgi:hypothetical protein
VTAASRLLPSGDTGATLPFDALDWQNKAHREVAAVWTYAVAPLTTVAGTNTVTAASDTTVVAAIAAYAKGQKFSIIPAITNTGAVTLNIDGRGAVAVKDADGNALAAGSWVAGRMYTVEHDGTNFRKMDGSLLTITGSAAPDMIVRDEKTTATAGGTFTSGSMVKRTLNTSVRNVIGGASLASSQITLPAGTYYIEWHAPATFCGSHQTQLYNATDAAIVETGTSEDSAAAGASYQTKSIGCAVVTISSAKAFELQHRCTTTNPTNGFGHPTSLAAKEVYAWVNIWKTA